MKQSITQLIDHRMWWRSPQKKLHKVQKRLDHFHFWIRMQLMGTEPYRQFGMQAWALSGRFHTHTGKTGAGTRANVIKCRSGVRLDQYLKDQLINTVGTSAKKNIPTVGHFGIADVIRVNCLKLDLSCQSHIAKVTMCC